MTKSKREVDKVCKNRYTRKNQVSIKQNPLPKCQILPKCVIFEGLSLIRQSGVDANVLEEPWNPPRGAVLGGLLWGHERHPVVDEDIHRVLAVE